MTDFDSSEDTNVIANRRQDHHERQIRPVMIPDALKKLRRLIEEAFPRRRTEVVLYGSRARGDYRDDSDWDVVAFIEGYDHEADFIPLTRARRFLYEEPYDVSLIGLRIDRRDANLLFTIEVDRDGARL